MQCLQGSSTHNLLVDNVEDDQEAGDESTGLQRFGDYAEIHKIYVISLWSLISALLHNLTVVFSKWVVLLACDDVMM